MASRVPRRKETVGVFWTTPISWERAKQGARSERTRGASGLGLPDASGKRGDPFGGMMKVQGRFSRSPSVSCPFQLNGQ